MKRHESGGARHPAPEERNDDALARFLAQALREPLSAQAEPVQMLIASLARHATNGQAMAEVLARMDTLLGEALHDGAQPGTPAPHRLARLRQICDEPWEAPPLAELEAIARLWGIEAQDAKPRPPEPPQP